MGRPVQFTPEGRKRADEGLAKARETANAARRFRKQQREAKGILIAGSKRPDGTIVLSRAEELERGIIKVQDLDDAELANKQCRNASGGFEGARYNHSARVYAAMDAELLDRGAKQLRNGYGKALERLVAMLDSGDPRVAMMAIDRVMERVAGKVPDKLLSADVTPFAEAHSEIAQELAKALGYSLPGEDANGDGDRETGAGPVDGPATIPGTVVSSSSAPPDRPKPAKTQRARGEGKGSRAKPRKRIDVSKYID